MIDGLLYFKTINQINFAKYTILVDVYYVIV